MHVTHLSLVDYRSYAGAEVDLGPGATTVVGRNGQGKTNLVEALGYAASLSSHRVPTDAPLVREGAQRAVVRVAVDREGRSSLVELEIVPGRANRARLNRSPVRPREVLGVLRTVLFAPEDLALVKGDPDGRRRFLDDVLVALAPRLAGVRADYDRVLRQRNALLRGARRAGRRWAGPGGAPPDPAGAAGAGGPAGPAGLEVWDEHLAAAGAELLHARLHLVRRVAPHVGAAYLAVLADPPATPDPAPAPAPTGPTSPATIGYRCSVPGVDDLDLSGADPLPGRQALATALREGLEQVRGAELERGTTLVGPHRDDLVLTLDGRPARGYASHGESWSLALALRLGSWSLLRGADPGRFDAAGAADEEPVLVLDDVFAELDAGRRRRLASLVRGAEQVIITAAVDDDVPAGLSGAVVRVSGGRVEPEPAATVPSPAAASPAGPVPAVPVAPGAAAREPAGLLVDRSGDG